MQEEQKVIEAKIRMRRQELLDDEERVQRRKENIRAGRTRQPTPRAQPDTDHEIASASIDEIDFLNWSSARGNSDRRPQVKSFTWSKKFENNILFRTSYTIRAYL